MVRVVTEEVVRYLGAPARAIARRQPSGDDEICPDCDLNCAEKCARKTRAVVEAGADRISCGPSVVELEAGFAGLIDHTLLKPEASRDDIRKLCQEAVRFGFASVCINPWNVPLAAELVRGTKVKVCTVIGFPLGATLSQVKIHEAEEAIKLGAQEVDMVLNIGALKSGQDDMVESDIRGVVEAAHRGGAICKVIFETSLLTDRGKSARRAGKQEGGRRFRQDLDWLQHRRSHGRGRRVDARRGGRRNRRKGIGRSAHIRRFEKNGVRRRDANRRQRQRQNHGAGGGLGASPSDSFRFPDINFLLIFSTMDPDFSRHQQAIAIHRFFTRAESLPAILIGSWGVAPRS